MTLMPKSSTSCLFLLKGNNTVDDAEEDEAEDDFKAKSEVQGEGAASAIRPMDWFFHGWITFKFPDPMAPQEKNLLLLAAGDPYLAKGVPKTSDG
jgi:hypothetical protein